MLFLPAMAQIHTSTGFRSPALVVQPDDWTDPANVFVSDDAWASVPVIAGCPCPVVQLSWDQGNSFSWIKVCGPFGSNESVLIQGGPEDCWGHNWQLTELSDSSFMLLLSDPSQIRNQGYKNFGFSIPGGSTIEGISVKAEAHGNDDNSMLFVDLLQLNVFYTAYMNGTEPGVPAVEPVFYPNPFSSTSTLFSPGYLKDASLTLINSTGRIVLETRNICGNQVILRRNHLPAGLYYTRITEGNKRIASGRIIISGEAD